jgi:hypothetical protein
VDVDFFVEVLRLSRELWVSHVYRSLELGAVVPHAHASREHGALLARQSVISVEISLPKALTMATGRNAAIIVFE